MPERTCSIDGCDSKVLARGWCTTHYQRWKLHGDPGPAARIRRAPGSFGSCPEDGCEQPARRNGLCSSHASKAYRATAGTCSIDGCTGRINARGVCGKHYQQIAKGILDHPLAAEILRDRPCSVDDCDRPVFSRDLCTMHWNRNHRNGEPGEAEVRRTVYEPDRVCAVDNCERPPRWREHCASHATRFRRFGITADEFAGILQRQQGRCAICRTQQPGGSGDWLIDHDHVTGQVRGLLCNKCNLAIGLLRDDPKVITAALRYVERHRQMQIFGPAGPT